MPRVSVPPPLEVHVQAAWRAQLAAASKTPGLEVELQHRRHELFPRFAATYLELQALPRRVRRALQRQWRLPLATLAFWLALTATPVQAATITVAGACTLVDAITAANTDTATGGCRAGRGADTIVLPAGSLQRLTQSNNGTYGPTGLPVVRSVITIVGNGSTIARARGEPFRILAVNSSGKLTLRETTVTGGQTPENRRGGGIANYGGTLTVLNSTISGNSSNLSFPSCCGGAGGGLLNVDGTVTVTDSTILGNAAYGPGGGVANYDGTVTVTDSTISGNVANGGSGAGGGIATLGGTVTVTDSTISGNVSEGDDGEGGGGVYNRNGLLTVINSMISGNVANYGGGGVANYSTATVTNTTISDNVATYGGGGVFNRGTLTISNSAISDNVSQGSGGGVSSDYSSSALYVSNSTISGNATNFSGGGLSSNGTVTLSNSSIVGNSAAGYFGGGGVHTSGQLTLVRTLISGNTASNGPEIYNQGTIVADSYNLLGVDGTAGVVGLRLGPTDIVPPAGVLLADILEPLADNGGPTQTHALVPGSLAIDAAGPVCLDANGNPLTTDQRGRPRPVDGNGDGVVACDIGAFEVQP